MILNHVVLAFSWILYCVLHSVLAAPKWKVKLRRHLRQGQRYRLWYTILSFVLLVPIIWFQLRMPTVRLIEPGKFISAAGIFIGAGGLLLMAVCIKKYFMSLSGLRTLLEENYSNELQVSGVHKYVRHPLYLGTFAFIWGLFLLLPLLSLLISNVIITVYTLIGIQLEERKLVKEFGENYKMYRHRVPMLLPSFRRKREQ